MDERILPKPRLLPKKRESICKCASVFVVEQTRMLECQKCGRVIHPFDYLMKLAVRQNNIDITIQILQSEKKRLERDVEDLKRQRKNIRSQIARANKTHRHLDM